MKILFVIPAVFTDERAIEFKKNLAILKKQIEMNKIESRIVVVSHECDNFNNFNDDGVEKLVNNEMYNCAKSLNMGIDAIVDEDYYCFMHDDINVRFPYWIKLFAGLIDTSDFKIGALGLVPHTGSFVGKVNDLVDEHLWSDGVTFIKVSTLKETGRFDEQFLGDCEAQDFQYRMICNGCKNFIINVPFTHNSIPFIRKLGTTTKMEIVKETRRLFKEKWDGRQVGNLKFTFVPRKKHESIVS